MAKRWAACRCFYKRNFYVKQLDEHLEYFGDEQFLFQNQNLLKNCDSTKVLEEVKTEVSRRKNRFADVEDKRNKILSAYQPSFDPSLPGILDFSTFNPSVICDDVYSFPAFDPSFCDEFMNEIDKFKTCGVAASKVNSMIQHGVLMTEIGFNPLIDKLLPMVEKLSWDLFPEFVGGSGLDSYKAFTIEYDAETKDHQKDLGTHFDNAEITLNISLTDDHDGGELYFVRNDKFIPMEHKKGVGILHLGQEMHGAMPLAAGRRTNLIIWFRSSSVRNTECPMCGDTPDLEEVAVGESRGDGFTFAQTSWCKAQ